MTAPPHPHERSRCYAGIGSRRAPVEMLSLAEMVAERLAEKGWTLRTGHAPGMDQAFERGAGRQAEVYLPWPSFEHSEPLDADVIVDRPTSGAYNMSARYHPAWDRLSKGAKALHARNAHQILGRDLNDPVRFVLYWAPQPGGSHQALRIAGDAPGVSFFDLAERAVLERVESLLVIA